MSKQRMDVERGGEKTVDKAKVIDTDGKTEENRMQAMQY